MPSRNRMLLVFALCGLFASVAPTSASAFQSRRVRQDIKQAHLYLRMKLPDRAREVLTETVATAPGRSDPLAWLALGQAYYFERRIDDAGRAMDRALSLGVRAAIGPRKWAKTFLSRYRRNVGAVTLDGGDCASPTIPAQLEAPMASETREALLDAVPGWQAGALIRKQGERFFLPVGRYRFGDTKVTVAGERTTRLVAAEVGATCSPALPPPSVDVVVTAVAPPPPPLAPASPETSVTAIPVEGGSSWFEDNWIWVVVGAVVVAGGAAAAIGVAASGGPDQVSFNPNPPSFRGD